MKRSIPSLQSLLCFEAVAKHGSHTHAAQALFMTQSAVSRQVKQLGEFLGVALFVRTRHGVELTTAGRMYLKSVTSHLLGLERSTVDLMNHKGLGGVLKLGVVPTFATRWLLPKLQDFNERHPKINLHLETSTKPFLFSENMFDAAIFAGTPQQIRQWPGVQAHHLMDESLVLVASPKLLIERFGESVIAANGECDLADDELSKMPLLQQTTRPTIWQEWFLANHIDHYSPFSGQRYELFSMLAVAAAQGMGMALIPRMLIEQELQSGQLIIISDKTLVSYRAYYIVHANQDISPMVDSFVKWVKSYL